MKFKPLCHDYHSEAVHLWSEQFPQKEMKPLRIHISPQMLDQDDENDAANIICEKGDEEQSNEQEQEQEHAVTSSPLMDSTNQAVEIQITTTAAKAGSKRSKNSLKQTGVDSNTSSRRRRRKRRRDSPETRSSPTMKETSVPEAQSKDQTASRGKQQRQSHTVEENPLKGDPRKGQRRWRRRKISNAAIDSQPSFQTPHPSVGAKDKGQGYPHDRESMEVDLDPSSKGKHRKSLASVSSPMTQQYREDLMESHDLQQTDLVETLRPQMVQNEAELSNNIVHHEKRPQDMSVKRCGSSCSPPSVNQRIRRRQRRLVNAICNSTIGSTGIIVLPPKLFTIYDSPLLVSLWTNIRRRANRKRIANYEWWSDPSKSSQSNMMDDNAARVSFWRQPIVCPQFQSSISYWWRRRTEIAFFRQFSRSISITATAKLEHCLSFLTLRHLSSRHQGKRPISIKTLVVPKKDTAKAKKKKSRKLPYRYCLLDILQGNAGTFWNVSLGSSSDRRETRKRELKAIVPYGSMPQSSIVEVQQRLQFAILLALNVTRNQDDGNNQSLQQHRQEQVRDGVGKLDSSQEQQSLLPGKRKADDANERVVPPKKRTERKLVRAENEAVALCDNPTSSVNDDPRLPTTHNTALGSHGIQLPLRKSHPPGTPKVQSTNLQRQKDIDQARKTELSLLERFGLAPNSQPTGSTSIKATNKRPPTISQEENHLPKRGKKQVKQHSGTKSSGLIVAPPATLQSDDTESKKPAPSDERNSFRAKSSEKPIPVVRQEQNKQSSVATSEQPSSCQPMSEVASDRMSEDRSEYYRNWQPKNFDLDDESVWSFNNNNYSDSDVQVVDPVSRVPAENNSSSTMEQCGKNLIQSNVPATFKPQAASRVVSEKKKRKRARKAAKKNRDHKRKSKKRKKKKKPHGELFDQPFPESVLQSLEEDAVEEGHAHGTDKVQTTTPRQVSVPRPKPMENGSPDQPIVIDGGSDAEEEDHTAFPQHEERPPLLLLCSEDFLDSWGDTAARLVSGDWQQKSSRCTIGDGPGRRFLFVDTNLVDTCGVDIELPNRGGVVVSALSSWNEDDGFNALMMRVVGLISTTRFRHLSVFLCADVDQDDDIVDRIATLQNAVLHQGDGLVTATTFTLVSPNALAASIGQSLLKLDAAWDLEEVESWLNDDRTFERLLFLVKLIPTLTATSILQCLMSSPVAARSSEDKSRFWFQSIFHQDDRERKRMQSMDPKLLHPGVVKQLSFALGISIGDDTVFRLQA